MSGHVALRKRKDRRAILRTSCPRIFFPRCVPSLLSFNRTSPLHFLLRPPSMEQKPTHSTTYQPFDIKDISWWGKRELGSPDDPYNQIPKLKPTDPEYDEYIETAEKNFEILLQVIIANCTEIPCNPFTNANLMLTFWHLYVGIRKRGRLESVQGRKCT